jgi:hypothetical protein
VVGTREISDTIEAMVTASRAFDLRLMAEILFVLRNFRQDLKVGIHRCRWWCLGRSSGAFTASLAVTIGPVIVAA